MVVRGRTTLTRKGQITIPASIRAELNLREGDQLDVSLDESGAIRVDRSGSWVERTRGIFSRPGFAALSSEELEALIEKSGQQAAMARDERIKRGE